MAVATAFDYVVVGGGPGGIATALLLADSGRRVALVEAHRELGGCHRVKRVGGLNTEHGPKVYVGASPLFFALACRLSGGRPRRELFARYDHTVYSGQVNGPLLRSTTLREKAALAAALFRWMWAGDSLYGHRTMEEFMEERGFGPAARQSIDALCRLLDGGGADVTLADSFLESVDSGAFEALHVPRVPLDDAVWGPAEGVLRAAGVELRLGRRVTSVRRGRFELEGGETLFCHRGVLALPPAAAVRLDGAAAELGLPEQHVARTSYRRYISATVEFAAELPNLWGNPQHPWSEIMLDFGRYAGLGHGRVLVSINDPGRPDDRGVTADSLQGRAELEAALQRLVEERYGVAAERCVLSPTVVREGGLWRETDVAWMLTPEGWFGQGSSDWLFTTGHHAGQGAIRLNTCESAVQNAHALARRLEGVGEFPRRPLRLRDAVRLLVLTALALALALTTLSTGA